VPSPFPCITQGLPLFLTPTTFHLFTLVAMGVMVAMTGTVPVLLHCEVDKKWQLVGCEMVKLDILKNLSVSK